MAQAKIYPKGLYMDKKREGAPSYVKGKLSIKAQDFVTFLKENKQYINDKGYMRFDLLLSEKDGRLYFTVDTYKSVDVPFIGTTEDKSLEETAKRFNQVQYPTEDIDVSQIPF